MSTAIFVTQRTCTNSKFGVRTHSGRYIEDTSPTFSVSSAEIIAFDPENNVIPSCTQKDWEIAIALLSGTDSRLGQFARCFRGDMEQTKEIRAGSLGPDIKGPLVLRGANVTTYAVREASQGEDLFLDVSKFLRRAGPNSKGSMNYRKRNSVTSVAHLRTISGG